MVYEDKLHMTKPLVFQLGSDEYDLEPLKLERKKLYGTSEKIALDNDGNECSAVSLYPELSMILPKGGTSLGSIDSDGNWVSSIAQTFHQQGKIH